MNSRRKLLLNGAATLLSLGLPQISTAKPRRNNVLRIATWSHYHSKANIKTFETNEGVKVELKIYESNEAMLAGLVNGNFDCDIMVATNYTIEIYSRLGLIDELKNADFPAFDYAQQDKRMIRQSSIDGRLYGIPKNWGTTGYVYNSSVIQSKPDSWNDFWHLAVTKAKSRSVVHDYQLTAIGNALKKYRDSFNSIDPNQLHLAQKLLMHTKPFLQGISSEAIEMVKKGAVLAMAWTGDGLTLNKANDDIKYVIGKEGGEIWCDYFTIVSSSKNKSLAAKYINFVIKPVNNLREVEYHGYPPTDRQTYNLLPVELKQNKIMYPPESLLKNLEFGRAETLTDPLRAEILNKFRTA